ncbi:hypothetical protein Tco_0801740 [Tanacetum coccineum]|uniref:Uncharacterized protein n=1 Tax=Tanacetum coccineum TaxID=301880 RepID=A0ABQ4ZXM9_9ASTR
MARSGGITSLVPIRTAQPADHSLDAPSKSEEENSYEPIRRSRPRFCPENAPEVKNEVVYVSSHESADESVHTYIDVDNNRRRDETPRIEPFVNPAEQTLHTNFEKVFADESTLLVLLDRRHVEKGESCGVVYVPQCVLPGRCRVDSLMWCQEMMVYLAPPASQEENNAL